MQTRLLAARIKGFLAKLFGKENTVYYVSGQVTLPPPLSKSREYELCVQLRDADTHDFAREQLIIHNLRLVVYLSKKFEGSGVMSDDLISIGTIGLIKAVETFSVEKNIKLATYASRCIENEILMFLRKMASRKGEISIDEPLNVDRDGNELLLSDLLGTDEDLVTRQVENRVQQGLLYRCMRELSQRDRYIIASRYGLLGFQEHTQKEVADTLGISQSYISRLEKRILKKLRVGLEG